MKSPCSYFQSILLIHFSWIIVLLLCLHGTITNPCFILLFSCFLTIDLFNVIVPVILLGRESIKYMAKIENKTDSSMFYILLSVRKHISIHLLYLLSLQYSERIQSIFCTCYRFSIQRIFFLFFSFYWDQICGNPSKFNHFNQNSTDQPTKFNQKDGLQVLPPWFLCSNPLTASI